MNLIWQAKNKGVLAHPLVKEHASKFGAELRIGKSHLATRVERIGWGYKASGLWAMEAPEFRLFEDGFVRSMRPGYNGGALYSLVEDKKGIYYDGNGKSDLIDALNGRGRLSSKDEHWRREAELSMQRFVDVGASKYNWFISDQTAAASIEKIMPEKGILVIDQTAGDAGIRFGKGNPEIFTKMLCDALDSAGNAPVYVRTHPDALFRSRKSCFTSGLLTDKRVVIVPSTFSPKVIFPRVSRVFVFNSLLGMEALIHGCDVRVYGCAFYAGWGLTDDCHPELPRRERELDLTELFHTTYQKYSFYFDPNTGEDCSLDRILDHLELQKQTHSQQTKPKILFGLPAWKSKVISRFLVSPGTECVSSRSMRTTRKWESDHPGGEIYTWSLRDGYTASTATSIRTEDGFLRSVGLGANFHAPISLVFDSRGMYFDSTRPSDLEVILNETKFSTSDCERARQLIDSLVRNRITKYNLKSQSEADWGSRDQPKILVPGQVEADASLRYGQSPCFSNLAFLERVRRENPSSIIAYKPHPDVAEKLRPGSANLDEMKYLCDVLIQDLDIIPWLETCDEVHTLTSQTGFEALLRGKDVTCYGVPFYSGWGLTTDKIHCDRRTRKLRIEELVAGVLMDYPLYLNPNTSEFMTALDASKFLSSENSVEIFSRPMLFRVTAAVKRLIHPLR